MKKKHKKIKAYAGNVFTKNLQLKMSVNSTLKVIQIISQRKAFYRQGTPQSSCVRKETVDILVTSKNGDKIM